MNAIVIVALLAYCNHVLAEDANGTECDIACPAGWNTWGPLTDHCYLMPSQPLRLGKYWDQHAYCKSTEPTSYPLVINDLSEQLVGTAVVLQYAANWVATLSDIFLWFGGWTNEDKKWIYADGTEQKDNMLNLLVNLVGSDKNGTCLGAEAKTLGVWQTRPCDDLTGTVICEMPKRRVCGAKGGMIPVGNIDLSMEALKKAFPKAISIPFTDIGKINLFSSASNLAGSAASAVGSAASSLGSALGIGGSSSNDKPKDSDTPKDGDKAKDSDKSKESSGGFLSSAASALGLGRK